MGPVDVTTWRPSSQALTWLRDTITRLPSSLCGMPWALSHSACAADLTNPVRLCSSGGDRNSGTRTPQLRVVGGFDTPDCIDNQRLTPGINFIVFNSRETAFGHELLGVGFRRPVCFW